MKLSHRGIAIGGAIGLFTGLTGSIYTLTSALFTAIVCALIGWAIGRYLELRNPRL